SIAWQRRVREVAKDAWPTYRGLLSSLAAMEAPATPPARRELQMLLLRVGQLLTRGSDYGDQLEGFETCQRALDQLLAGEEETPDRPVIEAQRAQLAAALPAFPTIRAMAYIRTDGIRFVSQPALPGQGGHSSYPVLTV